MASLVNPFALTNIPEYKKPKNTAEALFESSPLIEKALSDVKAYNEREARQKEVDEGIEAGNYKWLDINDPAHKAVLNEYVSTGNSSGIQNMANSWQQSQERIKQEASQQKAIADNKAEQAAAKATQEQKEADEKQRRSDFLLAYADKPVSFTNDEEATKWRNNMIQHFGDLYLEKEIADREMNQYFGNASTGSNDKRKVDRSKRLAAAKKKFNEMTAYQKSNVKKNGLDGFSYEELNK